MVGCKGVSREYKGACETTRLGCDMEKKSLQMLTARMTLGQRCVRCSFDQVGKCRFLSLSLLRRSLLPGRGKRSERSQGCNRPL
jgi:hypothetical protein